ncbi:hypothetical protein F4808DRAFT_453292 [Astrocystis sublimbata]|nr:hypothetical protein F4808DRAFT_453292 [Astrocystis sublimbata]
MTDHTSGYGQSAAAHECYNCGMKGHMFVACPEETRRVPAGLEASRKRQATGHDHYGTAKRTKGPIVTHYPPPPANAPHALPPTFSHGPGFDVFRREPPYGLPARPPYCPPPPLPPQGYHDQSSPLDGGPGTSRDLHNSSFRDGYDYRQDTYRAQAHETSHRPLIFNQYDQHRLDTIPGPPYDRSSSAPDQYDQKFASHQTSHQSRFEGYPPAPGVDNCYQSSPPSYPPPHFGNHGTPRYGYDDTFEIQSHAPPPPGTHTYQPRQNSGSHESRFHARYDDQFVERPYEPQKTAIHSQYLGHRSSDHWHNREHRARRIRHNSPKGRSRSERRFQDRPARASSSVTSTPPLRDVTVAENNKVEQDVRNKAPANPSNAHRYTIEDFSWEEEMIFKELPLNITRDLIREPLPNHWTDDPIMPPKYGKETITSKYINEDNLDDFSLSVRETKAWQIIQYHPAFLPPTGVRIEKILQYESALESSTAYKKQARHILNGTNNNRQRGKQWGPRARGGYHAQHTRYPGREPRKHSPELGEVYNSDDQGHTPTNRSTTPSLDPSHDSVPQNERVTVPNSLRHNRASHLSLETDSNARRQNPSTPLSSASPDRPCSRHSLRSNYSQQSSRRSSVGSPLTPTEMELLGLQRESHDSDVVKEPPASQLNSSTTKRSRKRPGQLDAAYG